MTRDRRSHPPRLGMAIARWLAPAASRAELEGDLCELWRRRLAMSRMRRHRAFWRDVVSIVTSRRRSSPIKQSTRRNGWRLADVWKDVRFALRLIRRQPAFSALVIGTLTLGMAASTAIFTICDRVLIQPLPYPEPDRLVWLPRRGFSFTNGHMGVSKSLSSLPVLNGVGLYAAGGLNLGTEQYPARVNAAAVTSGFFAAMNTPALIGRPFDAEADAAASQQVVLSYDAWRRYFQSRRDVLGTSIRLNSQPFVVVAVMPRGFTFPEDSQMWIPVGADPQITGAAFAPSLVGRLSKGATLETTAAALDDLADQQRRRRDPNGPRDPPTRLVSLHDRLVEPSRPTLVFLAGLAGLLLLATCANVAGLLLSRLHVRERELAVRTALGASPARLAMQLVTECGLLTAIGSLAGFALAAGAVRAFVVAVPNLLPAIDVADGVSIDLRFFEVGSGVALVGALLFALGPVASVFRGRTAGRLRETRTVSKRNGWFTNGLLAGQVAAALVLLTATSAALGVVGRLAHVDIGFHNDRAAVFELTLPYSRYPGPAVPVFVEQLEERLRALPGVTRVGTTNIAPGSTHIGVGNGIADADEPAPTAAMSRDEAVKASASMLSATPDYFQAIGMKLVAGRPFTDEDRRGAPLVAIINQTAAAALWQSAPRAIGHRLRVTVSARETTELEVVGVVDDVRLRGIAADPGRQVYRPIAQSPPFGGVAVAVEMPAGAGGRAAELAAVREALRQVDPEIPVDRVTFVRDVMSTYLAMERLTLALTGAFAALALSLCAIGLYGALSQLVAQRTREIGIRMALGANRALLRWTIVGSSLRIAGAGILVGGLAAGAAARAIAHYVPALDPPSASAIVADAIVLFTVSALAAWVPARRASAVDPLEALRAE